MRMLKVRKKSISLIVVLAFLLTLFPLALPAFAADYQRVGAPVEISDDQVAQNLNSVKAEFAKGELKIGDAVLIRLPVDFKFGASTFSFAADNGTVNAQVYNIADNEVKVVVKDATIAGGQPQNTPGTRIQDKVTMYVELKGVIPKSGFDGEIPLTFEPVEQLPSGFDSGSVVVGYVAGGQVTVSIVDDETFGDTGGWVIMRIKENRKGALKVHGKSVKITLPKGFEWDPVNSPSGIINTGATKPVTAAYAWMVDGDPGNIGAGDTVGISTTDRDELLLAIDGPTTKPLYLEIKAKIIIEDSTRAKAGDIMATVGGDSKVTPSEIKVGTYGDYEVEVTAADATTVYAGQLEQKIADITLKEIIGDSLIGGRSVTLTLPDWAKWGNIKASYNDGTKAGLKDLTFPGKDGRVAKFVVDETLTGAGAAKIKLDKLEVVLSPQAPEGDLEVEFGGSAGVTGSVKVAEVKKPLEVTASSSPVIGIGKADQAIGEITITEAKAELLKKDKDLVIELPKDVEWDDYEVSEEEGDLDISRATDKNQYLYIRIKDDSREAGTIKVTNGAVTAFRSVPEGRVIAEIKGDAIVVVNDVTEVNKYYGRDAGNATQDWQIAGKDAIKFDKDGLFPKEEYVDAVQVATVGTPAPGEQKLKAVFKLGDTNWTLNDVAQTMDVAPYAKDGRTYLPMRYVAKALGIPDTGILWKAGTATFISADRVVSVTIGSNVMTINGAPVPIDAAPEITNGRTMLPIRWVATAFGINVDWNAETQEVTVY